MGPLVLHHKKKPPTGRFPVGGFKLVFSRNYFAGEVAEVAEAFSSIFLR